MVITATALIAIALASLPHWNELRASSAHVRPDPTWILLAVAFTTGHYLISLSLWRKSLAVAGSPLTRRGVLDTWVPGLLARYIPGKVWSNGIRLALSRRAGGQWPTVAGALGWEALVAVSSACAVGMLYFARHPDSDWYYPVLLFLGASVCGLVVLAILASRQGLPQWLQRLGLTNHPNAASMIGSLFLINVFGWFVFGAIHWALARSIIPLPIDELPHLVGAAAIAWTGGYLTVIMPAGLGVREGLLVVLLGDSIGPANAFFIGLAIRAINLAMDLAITPIWLLIRNAASNSPTPPSS